MQYLHQCISPGCNLKHLITTHFGKKLAIEVKYLPCLYLLAWEEELKNDVDSVFLLKGIKNGFDIIDKDVEVTPVQLPNHPSAKPGSELYETATDQVLSENECGNCVICDTPPKIRFN